MNPLPFKPEDITVPVILDAMAHNKTRGLNAAEVRDSVADCLFRGETNWEPKLKPFLDGIEKGVLPAAADAFGLLRRIADTVTSLLTQGIIHVTLIREIRDGAGESWYVDEYYPTYLDVSKAPGIELAQKALWVMRHKAREFLRTAAGWREIEQSSFDFNWGDLPSVPAGLEITMPVSFCADSVTVKVNQDEVLIPELISVTLATPDGQVSMCSVTGRDGCISNANGNVVPDIDDCVVVFADNQSLRCRVTNGMLRAKSEDIKTPSYVATPTGALPVGPLSIQQIRDMHQASGCVSGAVYLDWSTVTLLSGDSLFDMLSERLTGSRLLTDIRTELIPSACAPEQVCIKVTGDPFFILEADRPSGGQR